jgi:hypothetical protein
MKRRGSLTIAEEKVIGTLKYWNGYWYGIDMLCTITEMDREVVYNTLKQLEKANTVVFENNEWYLTEEL